MLNTITADSLIPSVLTLFPSCRAVFARYGGLRDSDGSLGPAEPVSWFARLREIPIEQLLRELSQAAECGQATACEYNAWAQPEARGALAVFLRYGYGEQRGPAPALEPTTIDEATGLMQNRIWDALATCHAPDYPQVSIVDLGLVEQVRCDRRRGRADITMAVPPSLAPEDQRLVEEVQQAMQSIPALHEVHVQLRREQRWLERMKPELRHRLGLEW